MHKISYALSVHSDMYAADPRLGPLGSWLRLTNFMRHLHRRAVFFNGGMRDNIFDHFANIVLEIGIRECCQLANKSLRADWDAYPHSFLLYQEGIQVLIAGLPALGTTTLPSILHALRVDRQPWFYHVFS